MAKLVDEKITEVAVEVEQVGINWTLSDETITAIKEIENNSRRAQAQAKFVWFD